MKIIASLKYTSELIQISMVLNLAREERDARIMIGTELNTVYDEILHGFKNGKTDYLLDELGNIKENIVKNEYHDAEKSIRKMKKHIEKEFNEDSTKSQAIMVSLDKIRRITNPDLWYEPIGKTFESY